MATQYGFRKGKTTSQAIFAAKRLQDISEKSKSHSTLILLDWEKAFDKVAHDRMLETLRRLEVPPRIYNLIKSFYSNPQFKVKCGEVESDWHRDTSRLSSISIYIHFSDGSTLCRHKIRIYAREDKWNLLTEYISRRSYTRMIP